MPGAVLMYHDVVPPGRLDDSGFPGAGPGVYKLDWPSFDAHLDALAEAATSPVAHDAARATDGWLLTFDDGGACSLDVARALSRRGWTGHFLVPTGLIGAPGFSGPDDLREIRSLGHVVGSHSCSHPLRISSLDREQIEREWVESIERLAEIAGDAVTAASVPGGYTSELVERVAAGAGIRTLFTSLPTTRARDVDGCIVRGRYAVRATTTPDEALALLTGRGLVRRRQAVAWTTRSMSRRVLGGAYPMLRSAILRRLHM